jgi:hypothetical protein
MIGTAPETIQSDAKAAIDAVSPPSEVVDETVARGEHGS